MEAESYRRLCRLVDQAAPHGWRRRRQQFSDATIVKVFFRSTRCDRPVTWACEGTNWPAGMVGTVIGGDTLPSQPTMSRRLRTVGVLQLIERVHVMLAETLERSGGGGGSGGSGASSSSSSSAVVKAIDSKPLKVGSYSKDRDARRGRAAGEMARGYKLHALTARQSFRYWTLTSMNVGDQVGAAVLLPRLAEDLRGWGYVGADNGYDANAVHVLARSVNHQLIAPPRKSNAHVRDTRRNTPERIRALDLCANPLRHCGLGGPSSSSSSSSSFGPSLLRERGQVERNFGNAAMGGLHAPPPWVRTPHRVAAWVAAKIVQRMARQLEIAGVRV